MSAPHNIVIGDRVLVTTDNWFFAPNGQMYRAVFGTVKAVRTAEDSLGVRPNGKSTNWYLEIGRMTIAGCQIHYLVRTDTCDLGAVEDSYTKSDGSRGVQLRRSDIYRADWP